MLDRAYELGETHWDSTSFTVLIEITPLTLSPYPGADIYGDSEDLLGKWFARTGKRDEIFLTTKFANKVLGGGGAKREIDSSPEYCKEACAKSLKRLGVDCIDLFYW